jgi:hypothetical protein
MSDDTVTACPACGSDPAAVAFVVEDVIRKLAAYPKQGRRSPTLRAEVTPGGLSASEERFVDAVADRVVERLEAANARRRRERVEPDEDPIRPAHFLDLEGT